MINIILFVLFIIGVLILSLIFIYYFFHLRGKNKYTCIRTYPLKIEILLFFDWYVSLIKPDKFSLDDIYHKTKNDFLKEFPNEVIDKTISPEEDNIFNNLTKISIKDLNKDIRYYNVFSREIIKYEFAQSIHNRILFKNFFHKYPFVTDIEIKKPIVVCGLPRTGSTYSHYIASQNKYCTALNFTYLQRPIPNPDVDVNNISKDEIKTHFEEIGEIYEKLFSNTLFGDIASEFQKAYLFKPSKSLMEDHIILQHTGGINALNLFTLDLPNYRKSYYDLTDKEWEKIYSDFKCYLQILYFYLKLPADTHLIIKAQLHSANLNTITKIFPDACIMMNHRDPVKCIASAASLYELVSYKFKSLDRKFLGDNMAERILITTDKIMKHRSNEEINNRCFDVYFIDMISDPYSTICKFYDHFDISYDEEELEANINNYKELYKQQRKETGKHKYTAEQFGLDEADLYKKLDKYIKKYNIPI
eukprot:TRINITY_DN5229_c1_g1_i1.p1 TRINITY_DN5229_c1_g1~~TRINITY_DN5229_c1_g1_i1.p1  ORF type:complete len:475 (+),score=68.73 TRINITY_DN5229_c1_g1_i1:354-1778(+)